MLLVSGEGLLHACISSILNIQCNSVNNIWRQADSLVLACSGARTLAMATTKCIHTDVHTDASQ